MITDPKKICKQYNEWFVKENYDMMPDFHYLHPNCEIFKFDRISVPN